MKASELKSKSASDLNNELIALFKEQFNLRIQRGMGQVTQTHLFRNIKKQVARIKTILSEKEGL